MHIRDFRPEDAEALAALFHASARQVGVGDYTPEQVAAWSPAPPDPEMYRRRAPERTFLVAVDERDWPLGYADLEADGHIDHLYCRPDAVGTGVGSALVAALEQAARRQGLALLYVEASEAARRLLERKGFVVEHRREVERHGVRLHNYRMTRHL